MKTKRSLLVSSLAIMSLTLHARGGSVVYLASNVTSTGVATDASFTFTNGDGGNGTFITFAGNGQTLTSGVTTLEEALTYSQSPQGGSPDTDANGRFNAGNAAGGVVTYEYATARDVDGLLLWNYNEFYSPSTYNDRGITSAKVTVTHAGGTAQFTPTFILTPNNNVTTETSSAQQFNFGGTLSGVTQVQLSEFVTGVGSNRTGWKEFAVYSLSAVPEPSTYGLLGAGAAALAVVVRRRRRR